MSEKLRHKYYLNGYFATGQKKLRSSAIFVFIVLGIVTVFAGLFVALCIYGMLQSGDSAISGLPMLLIALTIFVIFIATIFIVAKRYCKSIQQWMEQYAKKNSLTLVDIQ
ncbi:hypothetical protein AAK894_02315 [Lachnospiraceae bacterium 46-61]